MNDFLMLSYVVLFAWSGAYWERYRFAIPYDSPMDRVLGAITVFVNALLAIVVAALAFSTGFVGVPTLGFVAASLFLSSLFLYRVRAADLRMTFAENCGRRVRPPGLQRKTRWPYTLVYMLGHCFMLAYAATIITHL